MKLELALLCVEMDCQEVFESTGSGYCPACGSGVALPMSQVLNRPSADVAARPRSKPFQPAPLRLVVPERQLERPEAMLDLLPKESSGLTTEGAELKDFRMYLEARLAEIDTRSEDTSQLGLLAETG